MCGSLPSVESTKWGIPPPDSPGGRLGDPRGLGRRGFGLVIGKVGQCHLTGAG